MGSPINVAVCAPTQLGSAFMVLLKSAPNINPLASVTDITTLRPTLAGEIPDVVLIYIDEDVPGGKKGQVTREQVSQSKAAWPEVYCIAIVKNSRTQIDVKSAGADVVYFDGVTPLRLLKTIGAVDKGETAADLSYLEEIESQYAGATLEDLLKQLGKPEGWWKAWKRKRATR